MSKRRYELDTRVLTVFFFVAMPFVAFGSFVVVGMAKSSLQRSIGEALEQRASETKAQVKRYVDEEVAVLRLLADDPALRAALQTRSPAEDEIKRQEQAWGAGDPRLAASLTESPAAARLRDASKHQQGLKLVQLTDSTGRLLASTARGGRYLNAEAPWFRGLNGESFESWWLGDLQRPSKGGPVVLEVSYAIRDPQGQFLGGLRALVDATDIYGAVIAPVRVGRTGRASLIRFTDGTLLATENMQGVLDSKFPGFEFVQAARTAGRGYWSMPEVKLGTETLAPRLVGYSIVEQLSGVEWMVVVEQEQAEAVAPINDVTRYLWIHFIGAFTTVVLLALYFSFKLEAPVIEDELHLHEEHVPSSLRKASLDEEESRTS